MNSTRQRLGIGLVGSGFMGKAHAFAFGSVAQLFELPLRPELAMIADATDEMAEAAAARLGFAASTGEWRRLVEAPSVDAVVIAAPNALHAPVALAALAAGKPVLCEKPLASTLSEARAMADAARASGVPTLVGYNYLHNPLIGLAREIVRSGEIGELVGFRGVHAEDYMTDPQAAWSFRHEPQGGGALMDLGSHIVSLADHLVGPIVEVAALTQTVHATRSAGSQRRAVAVDDHAHVLARFAGGAIGSLSASWLTPGRKMQLDLELTGTKGSIVFTQERFNEIRLFTVGQPTGREGFKTILAGPDHPPYGAFCPAPGHQLGFNDLKIVEAAAFVRLAAGEARAGPAFEDAWRIQSVIDAAIHAGRDGGWRRVGG